MNVQRQFLDVIDRDEAKRRFCAALDLQPLGEQAVPIGRALGRILARDVVASVDVPSFDRSNFDGFAVRAEDTYGAAEETPCRLTLLDQSIATGTVPQGQVSAKTAMAIATGGMLPRGADAVVMIEHTDIERGELLVHRAVHAGAGISFAGTDIAAGETVLRVGDGLTSRETGVLAAVGVDRVQVWRQPRVAVISTGDEILQPGEPMRPGMVFDSNGRIIADAVRELGGEPVEYGIVRDDLTLLRQRVTEGLAECDVVLLSGGTSKGEGDLSYRAIRDLNDPGILAHGVALKPGKPICLAASQGKAVVILPGFPTSAIFTFHEFVAPVLRRLTGRTTETTSTRSARLAIPVNSEIGRTEYLLVGLVKRDQTEVDADGSAVRLAAYPMGKGSGSVTTFSHADGFVTIDRHRERLEQSTMVQVQLLSRDWRAADLVVIGSHCVGLDSLLGRLQQTGIRTKFLAVGSTAGLDAAERGECDLAGIHLLDSETGQYNRPFLSADLVLIPGYGRMQGVVYRRGDLRFEGQTAESAVTRVKNDPACMMVNRNQGSGTRILIDRLLDGAKPPGYAVQSRSHNGVVAAVVQGRADWGVAISGAAQRSDLGFLPLTEERYDFVVPAGRIDRPAIRRLRDLLADPDVRAQLRSLGLT
jgi:putative molybdopterin biosynthesis protein